MGIKRQQRPLWNSRGYKFRLAIIWEPRDLWIGVYWTPTEEPPGLFIYLTLVPCLPLRLWIGPLS